MIASQWLLCSIVDVRSKMVFFFGMIKDQDVNGNIEVKVNVDVAWNYNFDADVLEALVWLPDINVCVAMVPVVF